MPASAWREVSKAVFALGGGRDGGGLLASGYGGSGSPSAGHYQDTP